MGLHETHIRELGEDLFEVRGVERRLQREPAPGRLLLDDPQILVIHLVGGALVLFRCPPEVAHGLAEHRQARRSKARVEQVVALLRLVGFLVVLEVELGAKLAHALEGKGGDLPPSIDSGEARQRPPGQPRRRPEGLRVLSEQAV